MRKITIKFPICLLWLTVNHKKLKKGQTGFWVDNSFFFSETTIRQNMLPFVLLRFSTLWWRRNIQICYTCILYKASQNKTPWGLLLFITLYAKKGVHVSIRFTFWRAWLFKESQVKPSKPNRKQGEPESKIEFFCWTDCCK